MKIQYLLMSMVALAFLFSATVAKAKTPPGLLGTITKMEANSFVLTVTTKATTGGSNTSSTDYEVFCDGGTKFLQNGKSVDATVMKEGLTVRVVGATVGRNQLKAVLVTIEKSPTK